MIIKKLEFTDVFAANCYFYIDEASKHGFVIDPSARPQELSDIAHQNNWQIEKILITHSHLDHIGAALELSKMLNVEIYGSNQAKQYLLSKEYQLHFTDWNVLKNMHYLNDLDEISLKANPSFKLQTIATPGHTLDSAVYYDKANNVAFCGDTIFKSGIGRTDIPGSGGDYETLTKSITTKILTLPAHTILYPGHGEQTSVKAESIA